MGALTNSTDRFNGAVTSLAIKVRCVVAAIANETLSGAPGTINGVAVTDGDRVLLTAQTDPVENGIWCIDSGLNGWVRAPDWDGNRDILVGTVVIVGVNGDDDTMYQVTAPAGDILVGTTAVTIANLPLGGLVAPIVLLDDEELQFGTGTDVRMLFNGTNMRVIGSGVNQFLFEAAPTFYDFDAPVNVTGDVVIVGGNDLQIFNSTSVDRVDISHDGTNVIIQHGSGAGNGLRLRDMNLYITESAAASADIPGDGQVWVRNDAPNTLMFTDDDGSDFVIGGALQAGYHRLTATSRIVGTDAGASQTGDRVIITGTGAGTNNVKDDIIIIGHGAAPSYSLGALTSPEGSIIMGTDALRDQAGNNANIDPNIFIGFQAGLLMNSTNLGENVVIGYRAFAGFETMTSAGFSQNTFIGHQAAMNMGANTVSNSVAIGFQAARASAFTSNSLSGDIFIGARAGLELRNAGNTVCIGTDAMGGATISGAASNVAVGASALSIITSGDGNVVIGTLSGGGIATESSNVIIGDSAATGLAGALNVIIAPDGAKATTGDSNIMIGYRAGATAGGVHFPIDNNFNFVIENAIGSGVTRKTFLYGRTDLGNLVIGQGAGVGGSSTTDDRGWGAGTPENILKLLDSPTVPTGPATNGATMYSVGGAMQFIGGVGILDDLAGDGVQITHDGTSQSFTYTNTAVQRVIGLTTGVFIQTGAVLRVFDGSDSDHIELSNNGTDGLITVSGGATPDIRLLSDTENLAHFQRNGSFLLYHDNVETLRSYSLGIEVMSPTSNDPVVGFYQDDGTTRNAFIQSSLTATLTYWRSEIHGGEVQIQGENGSGTNRVLFVADPDAHTQLNHGATDAIGIRTASTGDDDITSTGRVVDGNGAFRNIGFNELLRQTENGTYTFSKADCGDLIYKGSSAASTYTTPASTATTIPIGAVWEMVNNSGNSQTIAAGSGITLLWMDGGAGGTGNRTLADHGKATLYKFDDSTYLIWGFGLS